MCGLAGFSWPDRALAERMAAAIAHRGPDGSGIYIDDGVSLAHRRLSIIDLSDNGRQPMSNEDGTVWVTYNGEIYNFAALREELIRRGHAFRSRSDTETIVHAFEEWGPACVERLSGIFAFAVWDRRDPRGRSIWLFRDRLGVKPMYYAVHDGRLAFASEIKALLEWQDLRREIDAQAIYDYVGFEFIPAPATIFSGVKKLEPGCRLRFHGGRAEVERYWDLRLEPVRRTRAEHERVVRDGIQAAVERQLVSDVPIAVFLSGGLDSSALVAAMHRAGVSPIRTFSLGYADRSFSELEYARLVADTFGTDHEELIIDPVTPAAIESVVWHLDEPMTDLSTVPFYLLCRKVREHVKVCLSGEGGDEVFVGYDRFKASKAHGYYSLIPRPVRERIVGPLVARLPDTPQKKGIVNVLKRFIEGGLLDDGGEHVRWQYFGVPSRDRDLYQPGFLERITPDPFAPVRRRLAAAANAAALGRLDREIYIDTRFNLPDSPLMKVDKASMAHGLEVRVPLLDQELVEACATIPAGLKLQGFTTKAIFRTALRGILPEKILWRGKQGYSLPIKNWLRGELNAYMRETLDASPIIREVFNPAAVERLIREHMELKANHNHVLWAMMNLALWHRIFLEDRAPPIPTRRPATAVA